MYIAGVSNTDKMETDDLPSNKEALQDRLHQVQQQLSR